MTDVDKTVQDNLRRVLNGVQEAEEALRAGDTRSLDEVSSQRDAAGPSSL